MKYQNVLNAREEAARFIEKADRVLTLTNEVGENNMGTVVQGSASASVRRCSLELSHLLSEMRKSDWSEQ